MYAAYLRSCCTWLFEQKNNVPKQLIFNSMKNILKKLITTQVHCAVACTSLFYRKQNNRYED